MATYSPRLTRLARLAGCDLSADRHFLISNAGSEPFRGAATGRGPRTGRDRRLPLLSPDRPAQLFPLCGFDPHANTDDSHRRDWFFRRLKALAEHFAIDVLADAILSNHFHLVLRNRPDQVAKMSDREVVTAWLMICPQSPRNQDGTAKPPTEEPIRAGLADSLEGYQQVSSGERLRALDGEPVDTSRWLEAVELAGETDGAPVKVVQPSHPGRVGRARQRGGGTTAGLFADTVGGVRRPPRWPASRNPDFAATMNSESPGGLRRPGSGRVHSPGTSG